MILKDLANFIKPHLSSKRRISELFLDWFCDRLGSQADNNVKRMLQNEYRLHELKSGKVLMITPQSEYAQELLEFMREYISLMETVRQERYERSTRKKTADRRK